MQIDKDELLNQAKELLKDEVTQIAFQTWFSSMEITEMTENNIVLKASSQYGKEMLETRYADLVLNTFKFITNKDWTFSVICNENGKKVEGGEVSSSNTSIDSQDGDIEISNKTLNPKYTFETFVVGNNNRFAHAAAIAVGDKPGESYNPLFLYGGVGLGKTHLMQAIGNRILQNNRSAKILYVTSEKFTNQLINAIKDNKNEVFRNKYRTIDVLLIDDIQFIAGKERVQEEFFHTFNALHQANKQIIISSDKSPDDLKKIEERLRSRFMWGLPVDIYPPDFNLRCDIIRSKVKNTSIEDKLNEDVIEYIANSCVNDVRHIEGTINRLLAYTAMMVPEKITLDFANEALNDYVNTNIFINNSISSIQSAVAEYFKISVDDLKSKRRTNTVVRPRHIAMYLCRVETDENLQKIGLEFGGRDHSTVSTAIDKIKEELETNPNLNNMLKEIKMKLQ